MTFDIHAKYELPLGLRLQYAHSHKALMTAAKGKD